MTDQIRKSLSNASQKRGAFTNSPPVVKNITLINDISACFDWLTCTFGHVKYDDLQYEFSQSSRFINKLLSLLGSSKKFVDFQTERGFRGYKYTINVAEGIFISFKGPATLIGEESTKLDITGQGCRVLDKYHDLSWYDLFIFIRLYSHNYTRLDEAIDVKSKHWYTINELYFDVVNKNYISIWNNRPKIIGTPTENDFEGLTIYFGTRGSSSTIMRVYDKVHEILQHKGKIELDTDYWIRWEMQFSDRADQVIDAYINSVLNDSYQSFTEYVSSVLAGLLRVNNPRYFEFLSGVKEVKTFSPIVNTEFSVDSKVNWVNTSVFRSLMVIYLTYGYEDFNKWLMTGIAQEIKFYEDAMLNSINNKRLDLGLDEFTHQDMLNKFIDININFDKPVFLKNKQFIKKARF